MTVYSTSVIYRYTAALVQQVQAALPNVVVVDGPPAGGLMPVGELVWVGDVEGRQKYRALGNANRPREEEFFVTCWISIVDASTSDQQDLHTIQTERAFEILAAVETLLRATPTLGLDAITPSTAAGGYVVLSEVGEKVNVRKRGDDGGRETSVEFVIRVKAHL